MAMVLSNGKLGVIGAGVMGAALVRGLIQTGIVPADKIWAATKTEASAKKTREQLSISTQTDYRNLLADTEVILLCVKPSGVKKVLETLKASNLPERTIIISIVAGVSLETMESTLGRKNPIIRAMPNTPTIVGHGMTVICPGTYAGTPEMETAYGIFQAVGQCMELEESHFNAVTSLCGSGPAYLYLIMEALADGGVRVGLPREVALKIVTQTVLGAATMVQQTGQHPAALRDDVTTPAGCTIAGLLIMEDGKIRSVLARAVEEATHIAGQLGEQK